MSALPRDLYHLNHYAMSDRTVHVDDLKQIPQNFYDSMNKLPQELSDIMNRLKNVLAYPKESLSDERRKLVFSWNPFGKQTVMLMQYAQDCRKRGHLPAHTYQGILDNMASQKYFYFFSEVGVYIHASQLQATLDALTADQDDVCLKLLEPIKEPESDPKPVPHENRS